MRDIERIVTTKNARAIWKKLKDSEVPIVTQSEYLGIDESIGRLVDDLKSHSYMPSIGHGYLGYLKSNGCTRFVPVLTKEDMTVYYLLLLSIQDKLIRPRKGVFGAWRSIPRSIIEVEAEEEKIESDLSGIDLYYSNSFSRSEWFKKWTSFSDLIRDTTARTDIGNYVVSTDIANFYDTINTMQLIEKVQGAIDGEIETVSYLKMLLGYWDRRTKGYHFSTQGIPQELIGDASRTLANFFLDDFDERMIDLAESENQVYIRWADDIMIFGKSRKSLESSVHMASRFLMSDGLNLNAAKTRIFGRREFRLYRGVDFLDAVSNDRRSRIESELRNFVSNYERNGGRIDTVYRALIGHLSKSGSRKHPYLNNFIEDQSKRYEQVGSLNFSQIKKLVECSDDRKMRVHQIMRILCNQPYSSGRASFVKFVRKHRSSLSSYGFSKAGVEGLLDYVERHHGNSTVVRERLINCSASADALA